MQHGTVHSGHWTTCCPICAPLCPMSADVPNDIGHIGDGDVLLSGTASNNQHV